MRKNGEGGLTENKLASQAETRGIESVVSVDNNHIGVSSHPDISGMQIFYDNRI